MITKIKYALKYFVAHMLLLFGLVRKAKDKSFRGDYILSIYFHKPSKEEFEKCLRWLIKNNFKFLSVADINKIIEGQLSFPKGAVILTVDDGWQSNQSNIAATATAYQVPVAIFISTDPVEQGSYWWSYVEVARKRKLTNLVINKLKLMPDKCRLDLVTELQSKVYLPRDALTIEQVQQISSSPWITIGGHTLSHPILPNCSSEKVYQELSVSRQKLETWTGYNIDYFAYPNGDYSEREIDILQQQGYKMAFSVSPNYLTPDRLQYRYELPRFEVIEDAPFAETICRMTGVWEPFIHRVRSMFSLRKPRFYIY